MTKSEAMRRLIRIPSDDGATRYINLDRVNVIAEHADSVIFAYAGDETTECHGHLEDYLDDGDDDTTEYCYCLDDDDVDDSIFDWADDDYDEPISQLMLSNRAENALNRAGLHTVGQVIRCSDKTLKNISGIGAKTVDEITYAIKCYKGETEERE